MTSDTKPSAISVRVKELRTREQLSMQSFADRIGVSKSAVSLFEQGKNNPKLDTLNRIVQEFGVSLEWLTSHAEHSNSLSSKMDSDGQKSKQTLDDIVALPFITYSDFPRFIQQCQAPEANAFPKVRVVQMPDHIYQDAVVLEIRGNSMAPRYPERSRFVLRPLAQQDWSQAQGVHAIVTNNVLRIKRIISNLNGSLRLRSDANGEETEVVLTEVSCLWKVGEGVYYPAED